MSRGSRTRRAWRWYACLGGLAVGSYFALPSLGAPALAGVLVYFAISLSAAVALLAGVRWHRPRRPLPWCLLAAGQALYAVADLVFYLARSVLGIDTFPYYDDVLYLAAYPLFAAGLIGFVRRRTPGWDLPSVLDSLIVGIVTALLMWVYLVSPMFGAGQEPLALSASVAYPAMDLLLITVIIRLALGAGARSAAYRLLVGSMVLMFVADVGYGFFELNDAYAPGGVLELLWLLVVLALGAAGLHPSMTTLTAAAQVPGPELSRGRFAVLTLSSLTAPALLLVQHLRGADPHITAFAVACMLLFAFALARMGTFASAHRELADTDLVTGLRNRRYFTRVLAEAVADPRQARGTGLLLLDVDHFKRINDTYGHDGGDAVLVTIGRLLRESVRQGDVAARYGGEEFAILLRDVTPADLAANAERIRAAVSGGHVDLAGQDVSVTVSIGAVCMSEEPRDVRALIAAADRRLYVAKDAGRDRVVLRDGAPATPALEPLPAAAAV